MSDRILDFDHEPSAHYDHVTPAWGLLLGDELHYGVFEQGDEELSVATGNLTRLMAEASRLEPGLRVLDVGCGTGAPACHLAETYGVSVVGITTSAVGVDSARARARDRGLEHLVTFEQRDGTDNEFDDESFDRAWVLESSHLMPARDRLLTECARVVRPGGRLALCDVMLQRPIGFAELRKRTREFGVLRDAMGEARMELLATYDELATAAGFTVDTRTDLTSATLPTFERWRANARHHAEQARESLDDSGLSTFTEACDILESLWNEGTMGYGLIGASR